MTKAVWYGPNRDADLAQLVARWPEWRDAGDGIQCFHLHSEVILWDAATTAAGASTHDLWTRTVASGILPFLKAKGIPLVVELGVVKPGQQESLEGTFSRTVQLPQIVQRVKDAGGWLSGMAMDEPLTGWRAWAQPAGVPYAKAVESTAAFVKTCRDQGLGAILIEAYPYNSVQSIAQFVRDVATTYGVSLGSVVLDADYRYRIGTTGPWWRRRPLYISRSQIAADLAELEALTKQPASVIIRAIEATTNEAWVREANDWASFVDGPERMLLVESWEEHHTIGPPPANQKLPIDLPYHVDVVRHALSLADNRDRPPQPGATPPPQPGPPQPSTDLWVGATAFRLPQLQMAGVDIRPYLQQYKACGFNRLRVFGMKHNNTGWALDPHGRPRYFEEDMPRFLDTCKEFGLVGEWNALVDTRYLMPDHHEQQEFARRTVEVLRRYPSWTFSLGNEVTNSDWQTINLDAFAKPDGILSCHGSAGTNESPIKPIWDYGTFGVRRDPLPDARGIARWSHWAFESVYPKAQPIVPVEGLKPENYGSDTEVARLMGKHARCGIGGFFHFQEGINGILMPPNVEACARAFVEGLTR